MLSTVLYKAGFLWRRLVTQTVLRPIFGGLGARTTLYPCTLLLGARYIRIGSRTLIRRGCRLEVVDHGQPWTPRLWVGDHVNIEQNVHIVCHDRVLIGDHVSIAANCAIVDVSHDPERRVRGGPDIDPERSIVDIGEGTFIGFGVVVLPNVRIGKGCFIGAGSVVTRDIPDYMVAAGAPARILRAITIDGAAQR